MAKQSPFVTAELAQEVAAGQAELGAKLAGLVPGGRGTIDPSALYRWMMRGILVNGEFIKLESMRIGGRLVSSRAALQRFLLKVNGVRPEEPKAAKPATASRTRQVEKAYEIIAKAGA